MTITRSRRIVKTVLATCFLSSVAHAQTVPPQTIPRAKFEPEGDRVYHGASLPDTWEEPGLRSQLQQYQGFAGKRLSIVTWFASLYEKGRMTSWRNSYALPMERVKRAGAISLIKFSTQDYAYDTTHKMADLKAIAGGTFDAYFQEAARTVRDFHSPVFISIDHEMNGNWYPYAQAYPGSTSTAADYVAAWRHIAAIFQREGANNAAFVWSPNVPDVGPIPSAKYYPGDDVVDWVGVSFYSGNAISGLDAIYKTYSNRKPFFVTEWATGESKSRYNPTFPGDAKWVNDFLSSLTTKYPRVKAISWFQWNRGDGNYLLQRVPEQQQVYAHDIQSPRFLDSAPGLPNPTAPQAPVRQVVPNEVVLTENPAPQAPKRERIKIQIVPREQVLREK